MGVNPDFKKLFPDWTDEEIRHCINPCEDCVDFGVDCDNCVVERLWRHFYKTAMLT